MAIHGYPQIFCKYLTSCGSLKNLAPTESDFDLGPTNSGQPLQFYNCSSSRDSLQMHLYGARFSILWILLVQNRQRTRALSEKGGSRVGVGRCRMQYVVVVECRRLLKRGYVINVRRIVAMWHKVNPGWARVPWMFLWCYFALCSSKHLMPMYWSIHWSLIK